MATAFSYAQAAKRQLSNPPPAPQSVTSQAASTASSQSRDATTATSSVAPSTSSNEQDVNDTTPQPPAVLESAPKSEPAPSEQQQPNGEESAQKPAAAESPVMTSQDKKQPSDVSTPAERRPKAPLSSRTPEAPDTKKARKAKKPRGSEKESDQEQVSDKEKEPEVPKPQLVEATIPAVNFWVQRAKEAQTKTVPPAPARSSTAVSATSTDSKPKPALNESPESGATQKPVAAAKSQKKDAARDGNDPVSRRAAPRGNRVGDKSADSLPAVTDAASWPTPETAATEIKTVDTVTKLPEPEDAQDEKQASGPKEKTKWVPVPHVPTVNFNTPMPTRTPRGGRTGGSRGGRDAGARAGHAGASASVDRAQAARPTNDRPGDAGRTSTAPHPTKRASVDAANRDARKAAGAGKDAAKASSQQVNGTDEGPKAVNPESGDASGQPQAASDAPAGSEKRADSGSRQPEVSKESVGPTGREPGHHGGPRSERRGGQRGRGGHASANGQGHHHAHGSYPSNGQQYPLPGNMNGRQNSYPGNMPSMGYGMPGTAPAAGHRGGQRNSTSGTFFGGRNGRNGRGPSVPNNQPFQPIDPSQYSMNAMPQQQYFYEQTMMGMLVRQLSYYFSVNNLLKDSWLRKWMDTQGYVFLDVILNFQRMKDLTQDIGFVRAACMECPEIELVTGAEDNRDRVRRVEGWQKFVYPKGSRHPEVNFDDGPVNVYKFDNNSHNGWASHWPPMVPPYQMDSPSHFSPNGAAFPPYVNESMQQYSLSNGVNGHAAGETQLSADVPEFSPKGGSSASEGEPNTAEKAAEAAASKESSAPVNGTSESLSNGAVASIEVAGH